MVSDGRYLLPRGYEDLAGNWGFAMESVKRESWTTNITSDEGLA